MFDELEFIFRILLVLAIVISLLVSRSEKLKKQKHEEHLATLRRERDEHLRAFRITTPGHIARAKQDFETDLRKVGATAFFGVERSPLAYHGYRVGVTKGRPEQVRKEILTYSFYAEIPDFFPPEYRLRWGSPMTWTRYSKIISHLEGLAALREGMRKDMATSIGEWKSDAAWFGTEHRGLAQRFREL